MFKRLLKSIVPPVILTLYNWVGSKKNNIGAINTAIWWQGDYANWENALKNTTGYSNTLILEKVKAAALKVKNQEAAFERDSIVFEQKQYSWALFANLLRIAIKNDHQLNIIDFGGSLGSSYYQYKDLFENVTVNWFIVEQDNFYKTGKELFETTELKFAKNIPEVLSKQAINVILLSSVLQYIPNPSEFIRELMSYKFPNIIFDRTSFIAGQPDRITVQNVPPEIYPASYPCWFFNELKFREKFKNLYLFDADFNSYAEPDAIYTSKGEKLYWKGFALKLIN